MVPGARLLPDLICSRPATPGKSKQKQVHLNHSPSSRYGPAKMKSIKPRNASGSNGALLSKARHEEAEMYLVRFSYDVLPSNRQKAIEFIRREVKAAREKGLTAKLLIPITRGHGDAALQFELELTNLDQLDPFRQRGLTSSEETGNWMHAFSEILLAPPVIEILRLDEGG
jgi:hypothetical protein